jgi:hypothetical protein
MKLHVGLLAAFALTTLSSPVLAQQPAVDAPASAKEQTKREYLRFREEYEKNFNYSPGPKPSYIYFDDKKWNVEEGLNFLASKGWRLMQVAVYPGPNYNESYFLLEREIPQN